MIEIDRNSRSLLVGVTGGIASGKSEVARMLEQLGAPMIDFDLLARRVVEPDTPAWREIVAAFGEEMLNDDGSVNRERLGELVFRDPEQRRRLEAITHPRIGEQFLAEVHRLQQQDPEVILQAVVPLLIENDLQDLFDHLVVVYAPEELQRKRLIERDGLSREAAAARLRAQMPIEDKVKFADTVIDNSGTLDHTRRQVEQLWRRLQEFQQERTKRRDAAGEPEPS